MLTLVQYDNNKPIDERETELGKILYLASPSALAGLAGSAGAQERGATTSHPDYYHNHNNSEASCGHSHPAPLVISNYYIKFSYNSADPTPLFNGFPVIVDYFDFSLGGKATSLREAVFSQSADKKGLIVSKIKDVKGLKSAFRLPDLNIDDYFETYFLKYEPLYRYFAPILISTGVSGGALPTSGTIIPNGKFKDSTGVAGAAGTNINIDCGHSKVEVWNETKTASPDEAGNCSTGQYKCGGSCCYTESHTEPAKACYYLQLYRTFNWSILGINTKLFTPRSEAAAGHLGGLGSFYDSYFDSTLRKKAIDVDGSIMKDASGNVMYDYLIGSTYKNAIASAPSNSEVSPVHPFDSTFNKYYIIGHPEGHNMSNWENEVVGMWLSSLLLLKSDDCVNYCGVIENPDSVTHSSDKYLQCAQSFCDYYIPYDDYATNDKRECIVKNCKYKPKDPIDCSNPTSDSLMVAGKAATNNTGLANNNNSTCGFTVVDSGSGTSYKMSTKNASIGSYYDCKRYGAVDTEVENEVTVYKYGVGNIDNSYINVLCEENSRFGFTDLSGKVIKPGTGYYYPIDLIGGRNCELFFDTVSWTYDFASTHSLDRVRKRLLLQKVEAFNLLNEKAGRDNQINGSDLLGEVIYKDKKGPMVSLQQIEGAVPTISSFDYSDDKAKVTVTATTEEYVRGKSSIEGYKFYNGGDDIVFDRTSFIESNNMYLNNRNTMTEYNKYQIGATMEDDKEITTLDYIDVNSYKIVSGVEAKYELPKVCIDDTNQRVVSKANSEGLCLSTNYDTRQGLRQYYTDLKYENHDTYNNIKATTAVAKTDMDGKTIGSTSYIKVNDTCHYGYDPNISCNVLFENDNTTACYLANDIILENNDSIKAYMTVDNNTTSSEKIKSQSISATFNGVNYSGVQEIDINLKSLATSGVANTETEASDNKVIVYGSITLDNNGIERTVTCSNSINLIKTSNNANCNISQITGTDKYQVEIYGINDPNVYVGTGFQKDTLSNISLVKVESEPSGKFYFTRLKGESNEVIVAKVEGSNGSATCQLSFTCSRNCCRSTYSPDQTLLITEYCQDNYANDCRRYDNPNDCVVDCTSRPPSTHNCKEDYDATKCCKSDLTAKDRENLATVEDYCDTNKKSDHDRETCIVECYSSLDTDPKFRPINLNNPFPYSKYVSTTYNAGNRKVGKEWVASYKTISEDASQIQKGQKVEYKVHLTSQDIREISKDTQKYNDLYNKGSIYVYTTNAINASEAPGCTGNYGIYTGFCSEFIYKGKFSKLFSVRKGISS